MERGGKIWHKFPEEKPKENGFYAAITDNGYINTILYYTESGLFNWRGKGDDTHIDVEYWAELRDIVESARIGSSGDAARIDSTGRHAVIMAAGQCSRAKGKIGSWITLAEWGTVNGEYMPIAVVTKKIDGVEIKEDTFYTLENGEFKEVLE